MDEKVRIKLPGYSNCYWPTGVVRKKCSEVTYIIFCTETQKEGLFYVDQIRKLSGTIRTQELEPVEISDIPVNSVPIKTTTSKEQTSLAEGKGNSEEMQHADEANSLPIEEPLLRSSTRNRKAPNRLNL